MWILAFFMSGKWLSKNWIQSLSVAWSTAPIPALNKECQGTPRQPRATKPNFPWQASKISHIFQQQSHKPQSIFPSTT
jgi:hypothetical protein